MSGTTQGLCSHYLTCTTRGGRDHNSHFTDEKTEAQETEGLLACAQGQPWVSGSGRLWRV